MPNTASAKKRLRQNDKLRVKNRSIKSNMRSTIRAVREAAASGDAEAAQTQFRLACKKLDRAAAKNLIHKNAAARSKSRLSKLIKQPAPKRKRTASSQPNEFKRSARLSGSQLNGILLIARFVME